MLASMFYRLVSKLHVKSDWNLQTIIQSCSKKKLAYIFYGQGVE